MALTINFADLENYFPLIRTVITLLIIFVVFSILIASIRKRLLKRNLTKKQKSNVEIFSKLSRYVLLIVLIIAGISSYSDSWTSFGLSLGLFSAALGWALQKPITGIAAWIMIITKRPFDIGDRILIGAIKGDVKDISLTHVYISEVGGIVAGEENSGRIVMVPNSILFEQNIINYTSEEENVLDQASFLVTFESDVDKAIKIAVESAKKETLEVIKSTKQIPYVRNYLEANGMRINIRYLAPAKKLQEISSNITKRIFDEIKKEKSVELAYPHTEVVIRK